MATSIRHSTTRTARWRDESTSTEYDTPVRVPSRFTSHADRLVYVRDLLAVKKMPRGIRDNRMVTILDLN